MDQLQAFTELIVHKASSTATSFMNSNLQLSGHESQLSTQWATDLGQSPTPFVQAALDNCTCD